VIKTKNKDCDNGQKKPKNKNKAQCNIIIQQNPSPTIWGMLHQSNNAIMYYQKSCLLTNHLN
jgi:hypothetical protein